MCVCGIGKVSAKTDVKHVAKSETQAAYTAQKESIIHIIYV